MDEIFYYKHPNTWDYQWTFACWSQNGLSVLPSVNLVSNIGFNRNGTNTTWDDPLVANLRTQELDTILHPQFVQVSYDADNYTFLNIFRRKLMVRIYQKLKRIFQASK